MDSAISIAKSQKISDYNLAEYCKYYHEVAGSKDEKEFVGIRWDEDASHPIIHLPHGFPNPKELSAPELRKAISILIRTIIRGSRELGRLYKGDTKHTENDGLSYPFEAYRTLILDFISNGFIKELERKESITGSGRQDWAKTLKKQQPIWTNHGPVHLSPIRINNIHSIQDLTMIQKHCLMIADNHIGWLFGRRKPKIKLWNHSKNIWALRKVQKLKRQTYQGRKSKLLRAMEAILLQSAESPSAHCGQLDIGGNSFNLIWEIMVQCVLGNKDHTDYFPQAKWHLETPDGIKETLASQLLLDAIRFDENNEQSICIVIDAKYYHKDSIPQSSDINKQITYAEWVDKKLKMKNRDVLVENLFILPGRESIESPYHHYIGYATMDILEDQSKSYHKVHAKRVDTLTMMRMYLQNDTTKSKSICEIPIP